MIKNYIKTALRHFSRQKGFTAINMFGLTIGLACCIVIFLFVSDELSFDKYHDELDQVYRVAVRTENPNLTSQSATVCAPVAQVLKENFPQVEKVAQVFRVPGGYMEKGDVKYFEDFTINFVGYDIDSHQMSAEELHIPAILNLANSESKFDGNELCEGWKNSMYPTSFFILSFTYGSIYYINPNCSK